MKIVAIDGNSLMNRAFFGVRLLSNKNGVFTNAIFGFLNMLLKLQNTHNPDAVVVAFDLPAPTFRHLKYDLYKGTRTGMSEELAMQMPLIKEILSALGHKIIEKSGYEADDVLGTIARITSENGGQCVIATGDRDCLQLVSDSVTVSLAKTKETLLFTPKMVEEVYQIKPSQVIELKALMGDTSDNIPGVKGIGEKTATTIICEGNSLEEVYERIDEIKVTPRIKNLLIEHKETAFLSRELATICTSVPMSEDLLEYKTKDIDTSGLANLLTNLEMFSFFDKFSIASHDVTINDEVTSQVNISCEVSYDEDEFKKALSKAKVVDYLLTQERLLVKLDKVYVIDNDVFDTLKSKFVTMVVDSKAKKRTFMAKESYKTIFAGLCDYGTVEVFDLELAAYLLSPSTKSYDIKTLALENLTGINYESLGEFADILLLSALADQFEEQIESQGLTTVMYEIELPLCKVLAHMEYVGFAVDKTGLERFGDLIMQDINSIKETVFELAGEEFNPNSTKELGNILFEKLSLPAKKKTKTGYSTNAEVLEDLYDKHPIIPAILEYRTLTKLHSTYIVGLTKLVSDQGRIHTTFNQTLTRTGRISSTEPNVQNIPVRTPLGSEIRKFFVAKEGYVLVDADYSQIELRVLAHMANDQNMLEAFNNDEDIHTATASQVFGVPKSEVSSELRRRAKAINFGIVYGIGAFSLAKDIGVSFAEGKAYINAYLKKYSGVDQYMKNVVEQAKKDNYVTTLYGRRRDVSDINSTNKMTSGFGERIALNTPIQGTAADIIKLAMNKVFARLLKEKLDATLILQVHDELIIECKKDCKDTVMTLLKEEMEGAAKLLVTLLVEAKSADNWYDAK